LPIQAAGNQQQLKNINRMALVRHLCANPGLSRVDLAGAVGLQKSTVSTLVRELLEEGWLLEHDVVATGESQIATGFNHADTAPAARRLGAAVRRLIVDDDDLVWRRRGLVVQRREAALEVGAGVE